MFTVVSEHVLCPRCGTNPLFKTRDPDSTLNEDADYQRFLRNTLTSTDFSGVKPELTPAQLLNLFPLSAPPPKVIPCAPVGPWVPLTVHLLYHPSVHLPIIHPSSTEPVLRDTNTVLRVSDAQLRWGPWLNH